MSVTTATTTTETTLGTKLAIDFIAAAGASLIVSPSITIIDRAIIENANGRRVMSKALKELSMDFVRNPISFIRRREFLLIYGLYTATYLSANTFDTVGEVAEMDTSLPKIVTTTTINMTMCVAKDREFARMFGVIAPTRFPLVSLGLFAVRDALSVAASFVAPPIIAKMMESNGYQKSTSSYVAQMSCPSLVQFLSTPLHLFSLDLYNRKEASAGSRLSFISREYFRSSAARISRTIPAFGLGGIGNRHIREDLREVVL